MKKYSKFLVFFYAMLIGVMSMNLAACGDDDDDNANSSGSTLQQILKVITLNNSFKARGPLMS